MAKKSKKKTDGAKTESKAPREAENTEAQTTAPEAKMVAAQNGKEKPVIRAIRVTAGILEAAKAYKKATGVSFYTLGFEAISERLVREGFLKKESQ